MVDSVQHAKTKLHEARDVRDQRATAFWQRAIDAGKAQRPGQAVEERVEKPRRVVR
jgi:hypothetical protein